MPPFVARGFLKVFILIHTLITHSYYLLQYVVCAGLGRHSRSRFIEDFQGNDDRLHRVEAFVFEIFGNEK